jgi:hypothetical protein
VLPFKRPDRHPNHDDEASGLLGKLRAVVIAEGTSGLSKKIDARSMWQAGWEPRAEWWDASLGTREKGVYKKTLVGLDALDDRAKCVWCEQVYEWRGALEVDHFRPKAEVSIWAGDPPEIADGAPPKAETTTGFWWLAFDWTNWTLCCKPCNSWKSTFFPRVGPHLQHEEGVEAADVPLLLDPSSGFSTREHFRWNEFGFIHGESPRGTATIIACGLNRAALQGARLKVCLDVLDALEEYREALDTSSETWIRATQRKLAAFGDARAEFSGMVRWLVEEDLGVSWDDLVFE